MTRSMQSRVRVAGAAAVAGAALIAAGCGSSSGGGTATAANAAATASTAATSASAAAASAPSGKGAKVSTAKGSLGTYLVGPNGRALYLWVADRGSKSSCSGQCASAWPPLITKGKPVAGHGVNAKDLGTTTRTGGAKEVTYDGHPLYYFVADTAAGTTKGQGSNSFGAKWWVVAPSGKAITAAASSGGGAASSSSSSAGGGY